MITDSIADMFTRIRNSLKEKHEEVSIPYSKIKYSICQIMNDYGFIKSFQVEDKTLAKKFIIIQNKYRQNGEPVISKLERCSKSSKRSYVKKQNIPKVLNGFGLSVLSTSKGVMCGKNARLKNVGGELLGIIW